MSTKEDLLQRDEYINLLENIVCEKVKQHEGLSLAIDGKWGCGKTFIVEKLESKLKKHNYLILHYNCWENDFYDEPLVAIVHSIIDAITGKRKEDLPISKQRNWKKTGKIAAKFLGKVAAMILKNKVGVDLGELKFDVDLEKIASASQEALNADKEEVLNTDFDSNQPLKQTILQIRKVLLLMKLEFRGVIFIVDELDRCLPEYAIKVLERLHHICYNTQTDRNIFIQIAALNKTEMLGSIAKTFGRSFDYQMRIDYHYSRSNEPGPSSAELNNYSIRKKQSLFADYYFQKFFQIVIPIPLGNMLDKELSILNGFEKNFTAQNVVSKEYIAKFLCDVINPIPIRIKKEYLDFVKTAHQITALQSNIPQEISLGVLGVELVDCLFRNIFKTHEPTLSIRDKINQTFSYAIQNYFEIEYIENKQDLIKDFVEWGESRYTHIPAIRSNDLKDHRINEMQDPASYIKGFYLDRDYDNAIINRNNPNENDSIFVYAFRKTLDIIAPLK